MGRKPTPYIEGGTYHIYSRGNNRQTIFLDDSDYCRFLKELDCVQQVIPFVLYAYCLMPNHFHLVLKVLQAPLHRFMQAVLGRYAKIFNCRWNRVGHVFQNRFQRKMITTDSYFQQAVAYVHHNPVKAGLARSAGDWPWSSHAEYLGEPMRVDSDFALSLFAPTKATAIAEYLAKLGQNVEDPFDQADEGVSIDPKDAEGQDCPGMASLEALALSAAQTSGLSVADLRAPFRSETYDGARKAFVLAAIKRGHSQADISRFIDRPAPSLSRMLARWRRQQQG